MNYFKNISLLVTHYNRSQSLRRLLLALKELEIDFTEIIISDDNSSSYHRNELIKLKGEYIINLLFSQENRGLGNNINKGQEIIKSAYTLYVQEDFKPKAGFPEALMDAIFYMNESKKYDMARFYSYDKYPYLDPIGKGFSKMNFRLNKRGYRKFYYYSDHPHLRRSSFLDKFGRYAEGYDPEQTEYRMMMSFLQNKGQGIFYIKNKNLFDHGNTTEEPSTMKRINWRRSDNKIITVIRNIYRHVKFNGDYIFRSFKN